MDQRAVSRGVVLGISSSTPVSHFPLGWFLRVVAVALSAFEQGFDCANQRLSARAQLADAIARDSFQKAFPPRQQRDEHPPPVVPAARPAHVSVGLQAVDKFHRAMVL